jgi:hypothetical protein
MDFLAWYTLVIIAFGIGANIMDSEVEGFVRLLMALFMIPVLIFAILYLWG